jgi:hypothetical protein
MIIRVATMLTYSGFLGWKRFAMRYDSLKFYVILFTGSQLIRVLQEHLMDGIS